MQGSGEPVTVFVFDLTNKSPEEVTTGTGIPMEVEISLVPKTHSCVWRLSGNHSPNVWHSDQLLSSSSVW